MYIYNLFFFQNRVQHIFIFIFLQFLILFNVIFSVVLQEAHLFRMLPIFGIGVKILQRKRVSVAPLLVFPYAVS